MDLAARIVDRAQSRSGGCLGWDETSLRLAEGRVHELAIPVRTLGTRRADSLSTLHGRLTPGSSSLALLPKRCCRLTAA